MHQYNQTTTSSSIVVVPKDFEKVIKARIRNIFPLWLTIYNIAYLCTADRHTACVDKRGNRKCIGKALFL